MIFRFFFRHNFNRSLCKNIFLVSLHSVDLALKALEIFYLANGASVEGLADRNGHRRKVVGEGESVSWGVARTKSKGRECEPTKNMFLHSDLLKFCLKKKRKIDEFFPDTTVFYD